MKKKITVFALLMALAMVFSSLGFNSSAAAPEGSTNVYTLTEATFSQIVGPGDRSHEDGIFIVGASDQSGNRGGGLGIEALTGLVYARWEIKFGGVISGGNWIELNIAQVNRLPSANEALWDHSPVLRFMMSGAGNFYYGSNGAPADLNVETATALPEDFATEDDWLIVEMYADLEAEKGYLVVTNLTTEDVFKSLEIDLELPETFAGINYAAIRGGRTPGNNITFATNIKQMVITSGGTLPDFTGEGPGPGTETSTPTPATPTPSGTTPPTTPPTGDNTNIYMALVLGGLLVAAVVVFVVMKKKVTE